MRSGFTSEGRFHSSSFFGRRLWKFITRVRTNWFLLMVVCRSANRSLLDIDAVQLKSCGFTWCWGVEIVGGTLMQHRLCLVGLTCVLNAVWIPASDSDDALEMS